MNIKDLWIGDILRLKRSGRTGKFAGLRGDKLVVNVDGKSVITVPGNVTLVTDEDLLTKSEKASGLDAEPSKSKQVPLDHIDLHIEKLKPGLQHSRPERILDIQVAEAEKFIKQAIEHNLRSVTIVHGKGKGVLKAEIHSLISLYSEIKISYEINDGGGVELWFVHPS